MTFNKTIQTNVVEQVKTVLIVSLIVGIGAFVLGVNYQKNSAVTVENKVVVESAETPVETADVKK